MKKSSTLPGNLSQWSRKLSTSWTSFNVRVRKKSPTTKLSAAELIRNYELEEDEYLRELENLQRTRNSNIVGGVGIVGGYFQQRRASRSTSEASSIASSICVSPQSDLLGSFCHLMNYVVHLRRENRHLRKQVLCLQEMRKIEQLQNELLRAACTCCGDSEFGVHGCAQGTTPSNRRESAAPAVGIGGRTDDETTSSSVVEKLHSPPATCEVAASVGRPTSVPSVVDEKNVNVVPGRKSSPSFAESRTPEDPISSAASLEIRSSLSPTSTAGPPNTMGDIRHLRRATVGLANNNASAPKKLITERTVIRHSAEEALVEPAELNHVLMQTSAEFSGSSLSSNINAATEKDATNKDLSDSEDQTSVFTEVQLPNIKENSSSKYKYRDSRYHPFSAPKPPSTELARTSAAVILERLGIRPLKSKHSVDDQSKNLKTGRSESAMSPSDWSRYPTALPVQQKSDGPTTDVEKWKLVRKAFIKKRKRKISESDSVASSDASGKQYASIELPDISYARKISYPPAAPPTINVDVVQKTVQPTKEFAQKLKEWEEIKRTNISQKGDQVKRSWLKRPKQQRIDSSNVAKVPAVPNKTERYFEADDGRQMTVIEHDNVEQKYLESPLSPNIVNTKENRWLTPNEAEYRDFEHCSSEPNLKDTSGRRSTLAVSNEPRRKENDKRRSVTFCDHSGADTLSTATSQMTVSNDSVFTSYETDLNRLYNGGADLVQHLLTLQEKNSLLIRTLREKTEEYEKITDQLSVMENEVKLLRDRYRYDTALENIYNTLIETTYVPCSMVEDLESQIQSLDNNIRTIKSESYLAQQVTMENYVKEQAASRRYLDQIETLQKTNLQLIQRHLTDFGPYDPEIKKHFQLAQSYDSLFRFTMNLLRKLKHYRCKILEKNSSLSKLDLELLQTQSSLLLAHAQIERQKMEIRNLQTTHRQLRRTQSFHGQDLLLRLVNTQISFYLPFKLHGSRLNKIDHHHSDFSLYDGEDILETEFARLFQSEHRASGNYEELELPMRDYKPQVMNRRSVASIEQVTRRVDRPKSYLENQQHVKFRNGTASKSVLTNQPSSKIIAPRPGSCIVPVPGTSFVCNSGIMNYDRFKQNADVCRIVEENSQTSNESKLKKPIYATKAPTPLKLGNVGQVRSIAAAFDLPPPNDNPSSAPNTPLAKGAPHLCHSKEQTLNKVYDSPPSQLKRHHHVPTVVMRKSVGLVDNCYPERMTVSAIKPQSRIPVRTVSVVETPQQLGFSHPQLYANRRSPPGSDRPYETLTFQRIVKRNLLPPGNMDKSSTPEFESTSISTGGSSWSIAKRNEARRRQFFYGDTKMDIRNADSPTTPTPPPPPTVSPSPPKSPIPSSPTPLLGKSNWKSSKTASKGKENSKQVQNNVQETSKKRTSWFQKLRNKK